MSSNIHALIRAETVTHFQTWQFTVYFNPDYLLMIHQLYKLNRTFISSHIINEVEAVKI